MSLDQHALQGWLVAGLPVQQLPVLSTPPVFEFLRVHASDLIEIRLIDSEQTEAVYLPVTCRKEQKKGGSLKELLHHVASTVGTKGKM